jgi:tetratricopeptide (TPR) repeat protein
MSDFFYLRVISFVAICCILSPITAFSAEFADEKAALSFVSLFPGKEGNKLLASVRYKHAVRISRLSKNPQLSAGEIKQHENLALDYAMSALSLHNNNTAMKSFAAQLLVNRGDDASLTIAEILYEELYALNNTTENALFLAAVYQMRELYYKAIPLYENLFNQDVEFYDNNVVLLLNQSYLADIQFERGIRFFSTVIDRMPWLDSAIMAKVLLEKHSGSPKTALTTLQTLQKQRRPKTPIYEHAQQQITELQALMFQFESDFNNTSNENSKKDEEGSYE